MDKYTDEEIKTIIAAYDQKRTREKRNYDLLKNDEEFKKQNRERVKKWYDNNKEVRKKEYIQNKEFRTARSSYTYYKNKNRLDEFKTKYPEKYQVLLDNHYLNE